MIMQGCAKELRRLLDCGKTLTTAARMADMDRKTARKYRDNPALPEASNAPRKYRTRVDPLEGVWQHVERKLETEPRLKAYALFEWLQDTHPGEFPDTVRRTFERRVHDWRATRGPAKNVIIEQIHKPAQFAASDFTVCNSLGVTINRTKYDHTLYHCVLTYSNYEFISLCYSESFEAFADGIQAAFFSFGGVPQIHRTDSLSAAIRNHSSKKDLTTRYAALLDHYGCKPQRINVRCANENGDVESLNGKIKDRVDQALMLRGSRDFDSIESYQEFLDKLIDRVNQHRLQKFAEEREFLRPLPQQKLDTDGYVKNLKVSKHSTIRVRNQTYSLPSRLIGNRVDVRIKMDRVIVYHGDTLVEDMPRLIGKHTAAINYRHIIDSLVRKPGAFANFRYHEQMFPRTVFRIAYDLLDKQHSERVRDRTYLQILQLAAQQSEEGVAAALTFLIDNDQAIATAEVKRLTDQAADIPVPIDLEVPDPDLSDFDVLLSDFCSAESHIKDADHDAISNQPKDDQDTLATADGDSAEPDTGAEPEGSELDPDVPVPGTSFAEFPGSLRGGGESGGGSELISHRVSIGTDDAGDRGPACGSGQTVDGSIEGSSGEDLVELRLHEIAAGGDAEAGIASGWEIFGCQGKCVDFWETREWEEPCLVCAFGAIDSSREESLVYDVQLAGSAVVTGEVRTAITSDVKGAFGLRGPDHRRPGVCPAEPGGDGSSFHTIGGALRAGECASNEQSSVQQMGSDFQGRDDDCGGDRPPGASQRYHRAEREQLPRGIGQEAAGYWTYGARVTVNSTIPLGNCNCR
jgi:hypothetical protein